MTQDEVDKIKARLAKALEFDPASRYSVNPWETFQDHAPEDIAALIADVERLNRELERANDPTWPKE